MDFKSAMQAFAEAWTAANAIKVNKNSTGNEAEKEKENEEIGLQSEEKVRILFTLSVFVYRVSHQGLDRNLARDIKISRKAKNS